ncbi:hypothetical protein KDW39_08900 [Burkholderia multivorans]|uniref:hypothetical protein n=1 Tax=Burkholderia multivorans TaxID=87883 RepID=UPI001B909A64|nr:hypothetical protein [Burkholderia multivorans]MBR8123266.1 hypothetical protein [Burkholderia multivorans]MBU9600295.1 hypothetical protein [Burkholderia multivorans]
MTDPNHDIVPTLRMFDGVMTGLAADEIERLRKRVAELEADAPAEAREPAKVDTKARMDWADSIVRKLPPLDPTYAIVGILDDHDPDDRDEVLHSIRTFADMRATQALFTLYSATADAGEARLTDAARDVLAERRRQIDAEGWTAEHDDEHLMGDMALAGACYAIHASGRSAHNSFMWPWPIEWWKPTTPRRDLVKAGALILAELERLDRAALLNGADQS